MGIPPSLSLFCQHVVYPEGVLIWVMIMRAKKGFRFANRIPTLGARFKNYQHVVTVKAETLVPSPIRAGLGRTRRIGTMVVNLCTAKSLYHRQLIIWLIQKSNSLSLTP
ncbi:hypothetical protein FKM82_015389 [Ascaphus truei]